MRNLCGLVFAGMLVFSPEIRAATANEQSQSSDNTKVNKRDRNAGEQTADQAKQDKSDVQLMRQIRSEVVKDKSLSTYAHNVKIIAEHGKVTLKGPVHSEEEKKTIEGYAAKIAGEGNVKDELTVTGDNK